MAPNTATPDLSGADETHFSTASGLFGMIHALPEIIDTAYRKIHELLAFDDTLHGLLIALARDLNLLETWCRAVGFGMPTSVQNQSLTVGSRQQTQFEELESHLQLQSSQKTMELSLRRCLDLLSKIITGLKVSQISGTNIQEVDQFLESLRTLNISPSLQDRIEDPEISRMDGMSSTEALVAEMRRAGLLPDRPASTSRKASEIAKRTLPYISGLIQHLETEIQTLEMFVIGAKLDALVQVPPRLIKNSLDNLPNIIEGTMRSTLEQNRQIFAAAVSTYTTMSPMPLTNILRDVEMQEPRGGLHRITGEDGRKDRECVAFQDSYYVVEWISDLEATKDEDVQNIQQRLGNLVYRLRIVEPTIFRILPAVKYINTKASEEKSKFGLLYRLPDTFNPSADRVVSLAELISDDESNSKLRPLGDRFTLALSLATALRQFQTSNWLHEKLSSENILFVLRGGCVDLSEPFITGFGYSRFYTAESARRQSDALKNDYYQHPLRRRLEETKSTYRYRGEFDIYSLGRILLDIAAWDQVNDELVSTELGHLSAYVGTMYESAVLWCLGKPTHSLIRQDILEGQFNQSERTAAWPADLIAAYEENVLMKIAGRRV